MENLLNVLEEAQRVAADLSQAPKVCAPEVEKPKNWKKPKDMPRRPLSAYNLFFKSERQRIVSSIEKDKPQKGKGKSLGIGFAGLARNIASKWKTLSTSDRSVFDAKAKIEKARYRQEIAVWKSKQAAKNGPKKQKEPEPVKKKVAVHYPVKHTSSTGVTVTPPPPCAFDASDVTGQSLHQIMQDSIMRGRHQPTTPLEFSTPVPVLSSTSLNSSPRSSMMYPHHPNYQNTFGNLGAQLDQLPFTMETSFDDFEPYAQETVPDTCWKALAMNLGSDSSHPFDSVHTVDPIEDFTSFMSNLDDDCY